MFDPKADVFHAIASGFLSEKHGHLSTWAVSLCIQVMTHCGFEYRVPSEVRGAYKKAMLHLKALAEALPVAELSICNSTEIVCNCTYYRVRGDEPEDAALPIGSGLAIV